MYKPLSPNDISLRGFQVFKAWDFTDTDASGSGIKVLSGSYVPRTTEFNSGSAEQNFDGSYKRLVYDTINHLYYNSASADVIIASNSESFWTRPYDPLIDYDKLPYFRKNLHTEMRVFDIPQKIYGERIKPKSVKIVATSGSNTHTLVDDGNYNLYDLADSASYATGTLPPVGNVFYESGLIVLTSTGSYPGSDTGSYLELTNDYTLEFSGSHTIYELEVICNVKEDELNFTQNPTAFYSGSISYIPLFSQSGSFIGTSSWGSGPSTMSYAELDFRPFVTTIGLYNDEDDLIAVAKFGRPIQKENYLDQAFIVKMDL